MRDRLLGLLRWRPRTYTGALISSVLIVGCVLLAGLAAGADDTRWTRSVAVTGAFLIVGSLLQVRRQQPRRN